MTTLSSRQMPGTLDGANPAFPLIIHAAMLKAKNGLYQFLTALSLINLMMGCQSSGGHGLIGAELEKETEDAALCEDGRWAYQNTLTPIKTPAPLLA